MPALRAALRCRFSYVYSSPYAVAYVSLRRRYSFHAYFII